MRGAWLEARCRDLLPVPYFHVVFTLPHELSRLTLWNKRFVYGPLFRVVSSTLKTFGRDPKHLGAELGFLAILHTWGQRLGLHPHLHCVVPGGGLRDGQWIPARSERFLLPVKALSKHFRWRFLKALRVAATVSYECPTSPGSEPPKRSQGSWRRQAGRRSGWSTARLPSAVLSLC